MKSTSCLTRKLAVLTPVVLAATASGLVAGETAPMPMPAPAPAPASSGIDADFHVGYSSDYIFRGHDVGPNLFEFGLDFSGSGDVAGLGAFDWSAGVWYGSFSNDMYDYDEANNELDVYAEISKSINDMFSVGVGVVNFSYFGNGSAVDDDIDPYVTLGAEVAGIDLGATAYYDGANNYTHDWYLEFSATYERELAANLSGGLGLTVGFFDESDVDSSEDNDLYIAATASASYAVSENISVSPYLTAKWSDNLGDHLYGGVLVGFAF